MPEHQNLARRVGDHARAVARGGGAIGMHAPGCFQSYAGFDRVMLNGADAANAPDAADARDCARIAAQS